MQYDRREFYQLLTEGNVIEILCYILCSLKIALEFSVVNYFSFISLQRAKTESLLASRKKHLFLNLFYSLKVFVGWCILAKD